MLPSNDFFSMVQDAYADEIEGVHSYSRMAQLAPTECLKRAILDICGDELRHATFFDTILCCSPMETIQPTPAPLPMPTPMPAPAPCPMYPPEMMWPPAQPAPVAPQPMPCPGLMMPTLSQYPTPMPCPSPAPMPQPVPTPAAWERG